MKLQDIENNPLIRIKKENDYAIAKYSRKCFYNNTWDTASLNSRGHIYDINTGELIARTFSKIFNYGENRTGFLTEGPYFVQLKINGFMGAVTNHKGTLIYSTTGSTISDYAKWVQREVEKVDGLAESFLPGYTYLFEVCIPEDPHIIVEKYGLHFLCRIDIANDMYYSFPHEMSKFKFFVPYKFYMTKEEVLLLKNHPMIEGFVVWERINNQHSRPSFKIKTNDYLVLKFLARGTPEKKAKIFDNKINSFVVFDDEEMIPFVDFIRNNLTKDQFINMPEQDVLKLLREIKNDTISVHVAD